VEAKGATVGVASAGVPGAVDAGEVSSGAGCSPSLDFLDRKLNRPMK
jgi:hypothetical protein